MLFDIKEELVETNVERRGREEEVVNWSFVLKYLLSTNSKLRRQLAGRSNLASVLSNSSSTLIPSSSAVHTSNRSYANAFNLQTYQSVSSTYRDTAASKIQAGFRKLLDTSSRSDPTVGSDSSLSSTPLAQCVE